MVTDRHHRTGDLNEAVVNGSRIRNIIESAVSSDARMGNIIGSAMSSDVRTGNMELRGARKIPEPDPTGKQGVVTPLAGAGIQIKQRR